METSHAQLTVGFVVLQADYRFIILVIHNAMIYQCTTNLFVYTVEYVSSAHGRGNLECRGRGGGR